MSVCVEVTSLAGDSRARRTMMTPDGSQTWYTWMGKQTADQQQHTVLALSVKEHSALCVPVAHSLFAPDHGRPPSHAPGLPTSLGLQPPSAET